MKEFVLVLTLIILTACSEPAALSQLTAPHFPAGWTTFANANEYIQDLAFDQDGNLWTASLGGLVRWNISNRTYTKFTTADGLPSNAITAILPARDGTLWVATREGITSIDGKHWANYPQPEQHSLIANIYQDSHDLIWFTTEGEGVLTFDGNRWKTYSIDAGLGSNVVDAVAEDREGNIWLGTWFLYCGCEGSPDYVEGVSRYDGRDWTVISADLGLDDGDPWSGIHVTSIAVDPEGGLWFGTTGSFGNDGSGAVYYDGSNHTIFTTADGLPDDTINDIQVGENGIVWFATQSGLVRYDGGEWDLFTVEDGLTDNRVISLVIAPDQTVWAGTANGISSFDGHTWYTLQTDDLLPSNQVNGIDSTPEGIIWLATERGAAAFDDPNWKIFTTDNGIPGAGIASVVAVAPDGTTWIGTKAVSSPPDSGAIVHINRDDQISYTTLETLRNRGISEVMEGVYAIDVDASGDVWVGSYDTWHFDGAHWTAPPSSNCNRSERLVISPTLGIWIGSWGGVCQFIGQSWIDYGPQNENQVGFDVRGLAVAPDNAVWVATELSDETFHTQTAFKRFDGKDWTVEATMNLRDVTDMDFAADGTLWVATRDGAYKYDGTWTHYTVQDGLAGNEVLHIHVADDGSVWFATNDGLTRFENLPPK